jgi:hypothetical protein
VAGTAVAEEIDLLGVQAGMDQSGFGGLAQDSFGFFFASFS